MITVETKIQEIIRDLRFQKFSRLLFSNCHVPDPNWSLREMNARFYDWDAKSIVFGLNRMEKNLEEGIRVFYDICSDEEKEADPGKEETGLFFFPGKPGAPFALICPGGGYASVCTIKEGFPVAAHLNDLGYNAFVLCYQVCAMEKRQGSALLPRPIEDLSRAIRLILKKKDELNISPENYAVVGFSSGGHLAGIWGTEHLGAEKYGLPKPFVLFLGYPALDPELYPSFRGKNILSEGMFGENFTKEDEDLYNVNKHIDPTYPLTYLWHCSDDEIIPAETSRRMAYQLEKNGILHAYRLFSRGGHGFGAGERTEAKGWIREAVSFWEEEAKYLAV